MSIGFFLTARLGSTRLPRKHLLEARGIPLLGVLTARIVRAFDAHLRSGAAVLAIVTSDEAQNRDFERFRPEGIEVFYGSKDNIPLRHLQAAERFGVDAIVAVDGDDILCSAAAMSVVHSGLLAGEMYVKTSGLPLGMNAFGYTREFLKSSLVGNDKKTLETGWGYIFDTSHLKDYPLNPGLEAPQNLRFTLDYPEDYEFFKAIVEHFGEGIVDADDRQIIAHVLAQGLQKLTDPVAEKYWEDFRAVHEKEVRG